MYKLLIFIFALFFLSNQAYCQNAYINDFNTALRLAKETEQDLVVIFSAEWCGYCKKLKKDFPDINGFDDKIVCLLDTDEEKRLSRKFNVKSLPTSIMIHNGQETSRKSGYNKQSYEEWLQSSR